LQIGQADSGGCEGLVFDEEFVGEQLDPARWRASLNGYPTLGQFFGIDQTDARPVGVDDTATWSAATGPQRNGRPSRLIRSR